LFLKHIFVKGTLAVFMPIKINSTSIEAHKAHRIDCLVPDMPSPEELLPYLQRMHDKRQYTNNGPLLSQFEEQLKGLYSEYHPSNPISLCLVSSATQGLEILLSSMKLKAPSQILVPSLTFPASATSILRSGHRPVISDIDLNTWQLTPKIAYQMTQKHSIDAVMPVATFGTPLDSDAWDQFYLDTGIPVIFDAAGAFPFQSLPQYCAIVFSLHATKAFGIGEGGIILSTNRKQIEKCKSLTNFGFQKGHIYDLGTNAKLSEYHAAVGLAQINRWPQMILKRKQINLLFDQVADTCNSQINSQSHSGKDLPEDFSPSLKTYNINCDAKIILKQLAKENIFCRQWYTPLLQQQPLFQRMAANSLSSIKTPNADSISQQLLGLPFHNFLNECDIKRVLTTLDRVIENYKNELQNNE